MLVFRFQYIAILFSLKSALIFRFRIAPLSSSNALHHIHELIKVYFSISVLVYLSNSLRKLILGVDVFKFLTREEIVQLGRVDLSTSILVEHVEGCLEVVVSHEGLGAHSSSDKFSVVDDSVAICVSSLEDFEEGLCILSFTKASVQLLECDTTTVIGV